MTGKVPIYLKYWLGVLLIVVWMALETVGEIVGSFVWKVRKRAK